MSHQALLATAEDILALREQHRAEMNITEKLIRLSVGVEDYQDIIWDIEQALEGC